MLGQAATHTLEGGGQTAAQMDNAAVLCLLLVGQIVDWSVVVGYLNYISGVIVRKGGAQQGLSLGSKLVVIYEYKRY